MNTFRVHYDVSMGNVVGVELMHDPSPVEEFAMELVDSTWPYVSHVPQDDDGDLIVLDCMNGKFTYQITEWNVAKQTYTAELVQG